MKKKIDMLTQLLEKNNISLPDCSKKKEGGSNSEDKERVHALVAGTSSSPRFIIESGASRHMVLTKETFSSLDMLKGPPTGLEMVVLIMCCIFQVLPLISCHCIR